jgi:tetratricopeptide (TPR) repeat protein
MDHHDDLERYETTEARDLIRLFTALRSPSVEHAPANFGARVLAQVAHRQARRDRFAWLRPGRRSPWVAALATVLLFSLGLNTWLGYQVLERRQQGAVPALLENSTPARGEERGGSAFTFRGAGPAGMLQRQEAATLSSETALVRALVELAARHNRAGQYERGMAAADAALILDSEAALAYFYRGMAYNGTGNRPQAIQDVHRAARLGEAQAHDVLQAWGAE